MVQRRARQQEGKKDEDGIGVGGTKERETLTLRERVPSAKS
jgi:hypothetical protein